MDYSYSGKLNGIYYETSPFANNYLLYDFRNMPVVTKYKPNVISAQYLLSVGLKGNKMSSK